MIVTHDYRPTLKEKEQDQHDTMPNNHIMFHCSNCGTRYHVHEDDNEWDICPKCKRSIWN